MGQAYAENLITGSQSITATPVQLTLPDAAGAIVTALVASDDAWSYASEEAGTYREAGLNPSTNKYEKLFPIADAFSKMWFASDAGTITIEWDVLMNRNAKPNLP